MHSKINKQHVKAAKIVKKKKTKEERNFKNKS